MNAPDFKPIVDATADLARKSMQNFTDVGTKAMKDVAAFGDTVAKVQSDMFKNIVPGDMYENVSKMQADAMKTMTAWVDKFKNTK